MPRVSRSLLLLVVLPTFATHRPQQAQTPTYSDERLEGIVIDARTHAPLLGAVITVSHGSSGAIDSTTTANDGRFRLDHIVVGSIKVRARRLGYEPLVVDTTLRANDTLRLTFALTSAPQTLENVTVRERTNARLYPQFEENRKSGWGRFLTDEVLRTREAAQTADVLRVMGGVRMVRIPEGGMAIASVTPPTPTLVQFIDDWRRLTGQPYQYACYMQVMLDGARVWSWGTQIPLDVENFPVASLGGVELYTSAAQTPSAYGGTGASCGTVHFWTRRR